jgi:hypothetical protein
MLLAKTRPVLKKSILHQGNNNALLIFKSVEIIVIENDEDGKRKIHNPMYVPVNGLDQLLRLSPKQMEVKILQAIEYQPGTNTFTYKGISEKPLAKSQSKKVGFLTPKR